MVNDEQSIRALYEHANIPEATIKSLKARRDGTSEVWWLWHTPHINIDGRDIDGGIRALLEKYRSFFTAIKKYRGHEAETCLELVTYHQEKEEPQGFSLSPETISLLNELGAAFDNDCVYDRVEEIGAQT